MDNSIKLKELQILTGTLRKGDKGLEHNNNNNSKKKKFEGGWEDGVIPPLSQRKFILRDWERGNFLGIGLTQRFVSWVAWVGEIWLFLKVGRWDFFNFSRNYFLGGVGLGD